MKLRRWRQVAGQTAAALCFLTYGSTESAPAPDLRLESYLAHVAAANASLRLNEPSKARRWLEAAPQEHRGWEWRYLEGRLDTSLRRVDLPAEVHSLAYSGNGALLAAALPDGSIRLLDTHGVERKSLAAHGGAAYGVRFSPDGRRIVFSTRDGMIRCWEIESGRVIWESKGGGEGLSDVAFSPDGSTISYASWRRKEGKVVGILSLHRAADGRATWQTEFGDKPIVKLRFSPDGKRLAAGTWGWRVAVWDLSRRSDPLVLDYDDVPRYSAIDDVSFSPDGTQIVAATKNGTPRVWDSITGRLLAELRGHTKPVLTAAFSPDGKLLVGCNWSSEVRIWDIESGKSVVELEGQDGGSSACLFSLDGRSVASGSTGKAVVIWNLESGDVAARLPLDASPDVIRFSPDGVVLAAGTRNGTITLWDFKNRRMLHEIRGHDGGVYDLSFDARGERMVSAGEDRLARIWQVRTGSQAGELRGHTGRVWSASFHPAGDRIVTGSADLTVRLWDSRLMTTVLILSDSTNPVYNTTFSPDGSLLYINSMGAEIRVLDGTGGSRDDSR